MLPLLCPSLWNGDHSKGGRPPSCRALKAAAAGWAHRCLAPARQHARELGPRLWCGQGGGCDDYVHALLLEYPFCQYTRELFVHLNRAWPLDFLFLFFFFPVFLCISAIRAPVPLSYYCVFIFISSPTPCPSHLELRHNYTTSAMQGF